MIYLIPMPPHIDHADFASMPKWGQYFYIGLLLGYALVMGVGAIIVFIRSLD